MHCPGTHDIRLYMELQSLTLRLAGRHTDKRIMHAQVEFAFDIARLWKKLWCFVLLRIFRRRRDRPGVM